MDISTLSQNNLAVAIVSLILGSAFAIIIGRIANRTKKIMYTTVINKIGTSADDPVFGNIRVNWQSTELRNLYLANVEIENTSSKDLENVKIKLYTDENTKLMNEKAGLVNSTYIIGWSDEFKNKLDVPNGNVPTSAQFAIYNTSREYLIKNLNRYSKAFFHILCTRPNDDIQPMVFIDSPTPGINLKQQKILPSNGLLLGVPTQIAAIIGVIVSLVLCSLSIYFINSKTLIGILNIIVGLTAALWGTLLYKIWKFIKKLINK